MPKNRVPDLKRHKATDRAYVYWSGKRHYLGKWDTPEAAKRYRDFLSQISDLTEGEEQPAQIPASRIRLGALLRNYLIAVDERFGDRKSGEGKQIRYALGTVSQLFSKLHAKEFGPKHLKQCVTLMIDKRGWARTTINKHLGRIRRFFEWAVSEEMYPPDKLYALSTIKGLEKGRTRAEETDPVQPVPMDVFKSTLPFIGPVVRVMVQVQLYSAMRPQDVCQVRPCDINTDGDVWLYLPESHKNSWRDQHLVKAIPKIAQEILEPFLDRNDEDYCFSPKETWKQLGRAVHPAANDRYGVDGYCRAVAHAFAKMERYNAGVPKSDQIPIEKWSPAQLRHTAATLIEKSIGREAVRLLMGHKRLDTAEYYVELETSRLVDVASKMDAVWPLPPKEPPPRQTGEHDQEHPG